jgi:hypothetical protein
MNYLTALRLRFKRRLHLAPLIPLPNFSSIVREASQVASSFTQQADDFLRTLTEGLAITFPLKGNGADAGAPDAGAAIPDLGIDNLLGAAGLVGANGAAAPDYKYTPRATTEYCTVHLWVADLDFILQDCLVESLVIACTPGEAALITANIKVGALESRNDGVTFPTFTWGTQASLAAPVIEGVSFAAFGQTRGFEDLTITITNGVEETADLSFQLGDPDVGGAETELNAALVNVNNLQPKDIHYDRTGTAAVVELSGAKATGTTAGSEFMLEYN